MSEGADLARSLGPTLREQCDGRLGELEWFRAAWSRSGAATARADFTLPDDSTAPAIVKLPVKPAEHRWTTCLGHVELDRYHHHADHCTPRVLAAGTQAGPYDLAWFVIERFDGSPIATDLSKQTIVDLMHALARFQAGASAHDKPAAGRRLDLPFAEYLERSREAVRDRLIPIDEPQRWNEALKKAAKAFPAALAAWNTRTINAWCHGDVHPGNAMRREGDGAPCVLIDLGLVHSGHWAEDALYLERQFWGRAETIENAKPVNLLARARREAGLDNGPDHAEIASARRLLAAACVPALFATEGSNPAYVAHALGLVERLGKAFA